MKIKAFSFIKELFLGLQGRIKGSISLLNKTDHFQLPTFLEKPLQRVLLTSPFSPQDDSSLGELEAKYHLIKAKTWNTSSTETFWFEIHHHKDASDNFPF